MNLNSNFGLSERDLKTIQNILQKYKEVDEVLVFGSRANGNYKFGSDIDLAIMNEGVNENTIRKLQLDFEESSLPYIVDLVYFSHLKHQDFIDHIKRVGVDFYKKEEVTI